MFDSNTFSKFSRIVYESFQNLVKGQTFEVALPEKATESVDMRAATGDFMWQKYLAAFPAGTDPIYKKRTEHDCSCCKQFVRRVGNVTDGSRTIWDEAAEHAPEPYRTIAVVLRDTVKNMPIANIFLTNRKETSFGKDETHSQDEKGAALTWNHFYTGPVPSQLCVDDVDTRRGIYRTTTEVFERGLVELKPEAVETVLSLIDSNNLYRGEEHKAAVMAFDKAQKDFTRQKGEPMRKKFVWQNATGPASRFRNTAIGTLVIDLSSGIEVEHAVRSFETKVAPQNYKRTTAVITPGMIAKAMATIDELGLESALERRFARISDIGINDVLWVDNNVKNMMKGGLEAALMSEVRTTVPKESVADKVSMSDFMGQLKNVNTLEVFLAGSHLGNLVSLTAPVHPEPKQLFKWANDFSWSYSGNVADSIKERVKKAGGQVAGVMRVSLSWFNYDDLDLHIHEPVNRGRNSFVDHIYFGNRKGATGGCLDVDMNAGGRSSREPVENVAWSNKPPDGEYEVVVNQFHVREGSNVGFVVEIESAGKIHNFSYNKAVRHKQDVGVCMLTVKDGVISNIKPGDPGITTTAISQDKWGLKSESFVKVNAVTLSPNYWSGNAVGNKHFFFFLEGCKSDEAARGIYNEFLHSRLEEHRKVFEVIGEKTKCQPTEGQLSGLGFSSTKKETVLVRVNGKRLYQVAV